MKQFILYLLFVIQPINGSSQSIKIEEQTLKLKNDKEDTVKANDLISLGESYAIIADYTNSLNNFNKALILSKQLNYKRGICNAYNGNGIIYDMQGNYQLALKNYYLCLSTAELNNNKLSMAHVIGNIATVFSKQKLFKKALTHYYLSLQIYKSLNNEKGIANTYNNIGYVNTATGKNIEAIKNIQLALITFQKTGNKYGEASSLASLASIETKLNHLNEALDFNLKAIKLYEADSNKYGISVSYNYLGQIYTKQNRIVEANQALHKSLQIAKNINDFNLLADNYLFQSKLDSVEKNYSNAFENYKKHESYCDSINNIEDLQKSMQTSLQYEFDKKQIIQNFELKQQQNNLVKKRNEYILISFAIVLCSLIIFGLIYFRQKQKELKLKNQLIENEFEMLRLKINPHFIFNSMNSINGLIISKENIEAEKYLIKFSKILRAVLNQTDNKLITLEEELNSLTDYIELEKLRFNDHFDYQINLNENITKSTKILPLILQPFVENAILHGLKHKMEKGNLNITINQKNELLIIEISDDGVGRIKSNEINSRKTYQKNSVGISITTKRINNLKSINKNVGVTFTDLYDTNKSATGTLVTLYIPSNL